MTPPKISVKGTTLLPDESPRLLDQVRDRIRVLHYSIRTEAAYLDWIKRFILHFDKRHPRELSAEHIEVFLSGLAVRGKVSAATQNQAKSALLFLYREVLGIDLPWLKDVAQARVSRRLPVVLTVKEVQAVLAGMSGTTALMGRLLYGTGMRLMECVRLCVIEVGSMCFLR